MNTFRKNISSPGEYNCYIIAGNITKDFAIGEVGSPDDFYIIGTEPLKESFTPILSGNILDSNGELLFKLVRNDLVLNPNNCHKIVGDSLGYEIVDGEGKLILKVETKFYEYDGLPGERYYTTIKANFYNKKRELVFKANSGEENEEIVSSAKSIFGQGGIVSGYSGDELAFVNFILNNNGYVYERLTGIIENKDITLDGKFVTKAKIRNCKITISTGDFRMHGSELTNNLFNFEGNAANVYQLIQMSQPIHR